MVYGIQANLRTLTNVLFSLISVSSGSHDFVSGRIVKGDEKNGDDAGTGFKVARLFSAPGYWTSGQCSWMHVFWDRRASREMRNLSSAGLNM